MSAGLPHRIRLLRRCALRVEIVAGDQLVAVLPSQLAELIAVARRINDLEKVDG